MTMIRACGFFTLRLSLLLLLLLPGACHLTGLTEEGTLSIAGDTAWTSHDRLLVSLEDGRGADTLFDGKLPALDTLARLPAGGYSGGQAVFVIQGFVNGELVYEERRSYDGSRQKVFAIEIPFDRRRATGSPSLDLRPDQVRLYLGGGSVTLEVLPEDLRAGRALVWKTGNPEVARVSQEGVISPVGLGATYVQTAAGDTLRDASSVRVVRDIPVLNAGAPDTTVAAGMPVSFFVSVTQEYGDVAAFAWDLNADGVFEDSVPGTAGQTRFATAPRTFASGEVQVRFRVRDGEGNHGEAGKLVKVSGSAPDIDSLRAAPLVVTIKDSIVFAARATGNGADLRSFAWDFNGDGIDDVNGSLPGESAPVAGVYAYSLPATYLARLRIEDANGVGVSSQVSVTVKLDRPIADAGIDRTALPGAQVRLLGSDDDTLGIIVSREWKCGSAEFTRSGDSGAYVFTAPSTAGTTPCVYRVTDDDGLNAEDTLQVIVNEADAPTIPSFTPADTTLSIKDSVSFLAVAAAGTADLKTYNLDVDGDGKADLQGTFSGRTGEIRFGRRFPSAARFDLTLTVEDVSGKTTQGSARVLVLADLPKSGAGPDTTVVAGTRVNLRGTASDSLGSVVLREWKIGSGLFARVTGGDTSFIPTIPGPLVCVFRVTDDDGQTAEDIVEVTVSPSRVAALADLGVSVGNLFPSFASQTESYTVSVPNATASLTVTPKAAPPGATIRVNGIVVASEAASSPITLGTNSTVITILVNAQDTTVKKSYTVTVNKAASANADLATLTPSVGNLSPILSAQTNAHSVSVPNATASLTFTPEAAHAGATIRVNGNLVNSGAASGPITLATSATVVTILVTAQDTTVKRTYTVTVNKAASPNADLLTLTTSIGNLAPSFVAATTSYTLSVTAASIRMTPTAAATGATIQVNGVATNSGELSAVIDLIVGSNAIPVKVTAPDGIVTKTYTVTVTRISTDPSLTTLTFPAGGAINPVFTSTGTAYTITATAAMNTFTVRPTATAVGAIVTVDGTAVTSGQTSGNLAFPIGTSLHSIVVTAPDGVTTRTYNLTVNRPVPRSMRYGYARVDNFQNSHTVTTNIYNPGGGPVEFVREGTGLYTLNFRGLAAWGGAQGIVHVTSITDGVVGAYCKVRDWTSSVDLTARFACFSIATGLATDAKISAQVHFPRNGTDGHNAILFADQKSPVFDVIYAPDPSRAYSSGGGISIYRRRVGEYVVDLVGMGGASGGAPTLTTVGGLDNVHCNVDVVQGTGPDMRVYVDCRDTDEILQDAQFNLSVTQLYSGTADGVAVALFDSNDGSTEYAFNNGGGAISVAKLSAGHFQVTFAGLGSRGPGRGGNVQAGLRGAGYQTCHVGGWAVQSTNLVASVKCFDGVGELQDQSSILISALK